jgi:hypothetical protein
MQTHDELMNDLIEALKISSAYRQQQERLWRQGTICDYAPLDQKGSPTKTEQWH